MSSILRHPHRLTITTLSLLLACQVDPPTDTPPQQTTLDQGAERDASSSDIGGATDADLTPVNDASTSPDMSGDADLTADAAPDLTPDAAPDLTPDAAPDLITPCRPATDATNSEGDRADGWQWAKQGRVFSQDPENLAPGDGDFSPSLIHHNGEYRLYFTRKRAQSLTIWTSTSPDGLSWSTAERAQGLSNEGYMGVLTSGDIVRAWFGSGSIDTAESFDGTTFTSQQERVLTPMQVGDFASISLTYPSVSLWSGMGYMMWFTAFDGRAYRIGTASSQDGRTWTPRAQPVLERTPGTDFDSTSVAQPEVHIRQGGAWHMWYGGYDISQTDPGPWRVGLATSSNNGLSWLRRGVSVPLDETGDDMWSTRDPTVIKRLQTDDWLMIYVGMRDDARYRLLLATSSACPE